MSAWRSLRNHFARFNDSADKVAHVHQVLAHWLGDNGAARYAPPEELLW